MQGVSDPARGCGPAEARRGGAGRRRRVQATAPRAAGRFELIAAEARGQARSGNEARAAARRSFGRSSGGRPGRCGIMPRDERRGAASAERFLDCSDASRCPRALARDLLSGQLQPDEGGRARLRRACLRHGPAAGGSPGRRRGFENSLAGAVRGGALHLDADVLRRPHQGPHRRVGRQWRRGVRLRRGRAARHLPRHRVRARTAREGPSPQRALPEPRRVEVPGRLRGAGLDAAAWGNGVCAGDFDDDGALDLYVTNFGPNFLFRNNGDGTFTDMAAAAGVQAPGLEHRLHVLRSPTGTGTSTSTSRDTSARAGATWRGAANPHLARRTKDDGRAGGMPGEADLFFENRGDGTFVEATDAHGLTDTARAYGFGVVATDYDDDGWVDLFVANDTNPNFLYRNRGHGRFESVGLASGVALNAEGRAQAGMGVDSATTTATAASTSSSPTSRTTPNALSQSRRPAVRGRDRAVRPGRPTSCAWVGARRSSTPTWTPAGPVHRQRPHPPGGRRLPALQETFRQKNLLFLNEGTGSSMSLRLRRRVPGREVESWPRDGRPGRRWGHGSRGEQHG